MRPSPLSCPKAANSCEVHCCAGLRSVVKDKSQFPVKVRSNLGGKGLTQCIVGDRGKIAQLCEDTLISTLHNLFSSALMSNVITTSLVSCVISVLWVRVSNVVYYKEQSFWNFK